MNPFENIPFVLSSGKDILQGKLYIIFSTRKLFYSIEVLYVEETGPVTMDKVENKSIVEYFWWHLNGFDVTQLTKFKA